MELCLEKKEILNTYYKNNAAKLRRAVDKILLNFGGIYDKDKDDFYSLANEVFVDVLKRYDSKRNFDAFLYACLSNKIKTEITKRNRKKRAITIQIKEKDSYGNTVIVEKIIQDDSLDKIIYADEKRLKLSDIYSSNFDVEQEFFDKNHIYSDKMMLYLSKLSELQKEILRLKTLNLSVNEIIDELHITIKQYENCCNEICSYRNISILF